VALLVVTLIGIFVLAVEMLLLLLALSVVADVVVVAGVTERLPEAVALLLDADVTLLPLLVVVVVVAVVVVEIFSS